MKNFILGIAIAATTLTGCNSNSNKTVESQNKIKDTLDNQQTDNAKISVHSDEEVKNTFSIEEIVTSYLQLKNSLAEDNATEGATAATRLEDSFNNLNKTALSEAQRNIFEDLEGDARENAEHISQSSGKIAHQRVHFEMLSKDIYDLVKAFGHTQVLYKYFCQSYNNGKGAIWISETTLIKNPYLGKTTTNCGTITEEIK